MLSKKLAKVAFIASPNQSLKRSIRWMEKQSFYHGQTLEYWLIDIIYQSQQLDMDDHNKSIRIDKLKRIMQHIIQKNLENDVLFQNRVFYKLGVQHNWDLKSEAQAKKEFLLQITNENIDFIIENIEHEIQASITISNLLKHHEKEMQYLNLEEDNNHLLNAISFQSEKDDDNLTSNKKNNDQIYLKNKKNTLIYYLKNYRKNDSLGVRIIKFFIKRHSRDHFIKNLMFLINYPALEKEKLIIEINRQLKELSSGKKYFLESSYVKSLIICLNILKDDNRQSNLEDFYEITTKLKSKILNSNFSLTETDFSWDSFYRDLDSISLPLIEKKSYLIKLIFEIVKTMEDNNKIFIRFDIIQNISIYLSLDNHEKENIFNLLKNHLKHFESINKDQIVDYTMFIKPKYIYLDALRDIFLGFISYITKKEIANKIYLQTDILIKKLKKIDQNEPVSNPEIPSYTKIKKLLNLMLILEKIKYQKQQKIKRIEDVYLNLKKISSNPDDKIIKAKNLIKEYLFSKLQYHLGILFNNKEQITHHTSLNDHLIKHNINIQFSEIFQVLYLSNLLEIEIDTNEINKKLDNIYKEIYFRCIEAKDDEIFENIKGFRDKILEYSTTSSQFETINILSNINKICNYQNEIFQTFHAIKILTSQTIINEEVILCIDIEAHKIIREIDNQYYSLLYKHTEKLIQTANFLNFSNEAKSIVHEITDRNHNQKNPLNLTSNSEETMPAENINIKEESSALNFRICLL